MAQGILRRCGLAGIVLLCLALGSALPAPGAAAAARSRTSVYIARQPGLSITFKAVGRRVFVTSLEATIYCRGTGAHSDETSEETSQDFLLGPEELDRHGRRVTYGLEVNGSFWASEAIDARLSRGALTGTFLSTEGGGGFEDDQDCRTGSPKGSPKVHFRAVRYLPRGDPRASAPERATEAVYFADTDPLEILLWADHRALSGLRATVALTCRHRKRPRTRYREAFAFGTLVPPFPFAPGSRRFAAHTGTRERGHRASSRIAGAVGPRAITGNLSETFSWLSHGRIGERCYTGSGGLGGVRFRAVRYLPVAPAAS